MEAGWTSARAPLSLGAPPSFQQRETPGRGPPGPLAGDHLRIRNAGWVMRAESWKGIFPAVLASAPAGPAVLGEVLEKLGCNV